MALSDHGQYSGVVAIARKGIDEVIRLQTQAKQDEALIRQMRNALALPCDRLNATQSRIVREAIAAADAWLEGN